MDINQLSIIIVLFSFSLYLILKVRIYSKKYNLNPLTFTSSKDPIEIMVWCTLILIFFLYIFSILFINPTMTHFNLNNILVVMSGYVVIFIGFLMVIIAHHQMGKLWRVGSTTTTEINLIRDGLFSVSRNPVYTGMTLMALGIIFLYQDILFLSLFFTLFFNFLLIILLEEKFLTKRLGKEYHNYCRQVSRFIGFIPKQRINRKSIE